MKNVVLLIFLVLLVQIVFVGCKKETKKRELKETIEPIATTTEKPKGTGDNYGDSEKLFTEGNSTPDPTVTPTSTLGVSASPAPSTPTPSVTGDGWTKWY